MKYPIGVELSGGIRRHSDGRRRLSSSATGSSTLDASSVEVGDLPESGEDSSGSSTKSEEDFVHAGGSAAPRQIKSFAYDPEDMKDAEKVEEMPVKPSDFLKYLRFAQFEGAGCSPPAMEKESVCGVKKRSKAGIQTDKENVSVQQV